MSKFISNIAENVTFVLEFLGIALALILVAIIAEKIIQKVNGEKSTKILTTRKMAMIGMF